MTVQHGMDGALGRQPDIPVQSPNQKLADFARTPMWLVTLEVDDQAFNLMGQLVGIPDRPPRAVSQSSTAVLLVSGKDLVACLARYAELQAQLRHWFAVQQAGDEAKALFHHRTRFPRHLHLPRLAKGAKV